MNINTIKDFPVEIWGNIAFFGSENQIVRINKGINRLLSIELKNIKKIYTKLIDLQKFYDDCDLSKRILIGNFSQNKLEITICNKSNKINSDIYIKTDLITKELIFTSGQSVSFKNKNTSININQGFSLFNLFSSSSFNVSSGCIVINTGEEIIQKIHVVKNENITVEQKYAIEKAEKFANIFYSKIDQDNLDQNKVEHTETDQTIYSGFLEPNSFWL